MRYPLAITPSSVQDIFNSGDHIGTALKQAAERFRLSSLDAFDVHVRIEPSAKSAVVVNMLGVWIGFDEYSFAQWDTTVKTMKVSLSRTGTPKIWYMNEYRPLIDYLAQLKPPLNLSNTEQESVALRIKQGWEDQRRWWLANDKKFPLLDLPAEVREIIYSYAIGARVEPFPTDKARRLGPTGKWAILNRQGNFNLMLTSKLVHKEARHILFNYTPFFVEHGWVLRYLTDNTILRSNISQLEIALSHDEFVLLFRQYKVADNGEKIPDKSPAALALAKMNLAKLKLTFPAPSNTTASGKFNGACPKAVVYLLLQLAWPFVRGLTVELGGYMKTSQKAAFEAKINAMRKDFELWQTDNIAAGISGGTVTEYQEDLDNDGGVLVIDEEAGEKRESRLATENAQKIPDIRVCRCKMRCGPNSWTAED